MADLTLKQGDLSPGIEFTIARLDGTAEDLTVADAVQMRFADASRTEIWIRDVTIDDAANGIVFYEWQAGDTDDAGIFYTEIVVTWSGSPARPQTYPGSGYATVAIQPKL
jgi:hypothetical protein